MNKVKIFRILKDRKLLHFWIIGFFAFLWVVLRSGTNPKRLAYPCQQAAYPVAAAWFIAFISIFSGGVLLRRLLKLSIPVLLIVIGSWVFISYSRSLPLNYMSNFPVWEVSNSISDIFIYDNMPPTSGSLAAGNSSVPDAYLSDPAIDSLVQIMNNTGNFFYKSSNNPYGIIGSDDIVLIKANFQWRGRLGTNTDRIKGVVWKIINHPDGFTGEVLIVDNGSMQIQPGSIFGGINAYANNSEDRDQDIIDVVNVFKSKGYPVDFVIWDNLNPYIVSEYSFGDLDDGYIYNAETKVNYPKFRSPFGTYISVKHGIWNSNDNTYNKERFTIINMPVLKAHANGGATIAVKNWVGIMNQMHNSEWYGDLNTFHYDYVFGDYALPARVMDEIWPDLSILDATHTAIENNYDPNGSTVFTNTIMASVDPVALSWYAAKYILDPIALYDKVDPDYTGGAINHYGTVFNYWYNYLNNNTTRLVTKDADKISVFGRSMLNSGGFSPSPDITPTLIITPNISHGITTFKVIVRVTELNNLDTDGPITVNIPADPRWDLEEGYNASLEILNEMALNNSDWSYSRDETNHIFSSSVVIPAGGFSTFGFTIVFNPDTSRGLYTITSQVVPGSGGEIRSSNNADSERLDYFQ
jgi:hypothetical protein